ncbi:MAG: EF-hand domain-containing protein [Gammaproteobacteria bacterium]|nr:EF-hand domain-containing protein [Gammaproteobacteria bacterium]MBU1481924.1 EF-hand domain-containing protein [Gammaproteobacteria bacterium]
MMQSMRQKMAEDLFAQLDTSGQGYIDKSTLQTALDSASSSTGSTSSASNVDELFSKLDANGDGKVTQQEFTDTLQQVENQLQANANLQSGGMPPPPPPPNDAGFTKEELTAQLNEVGSTDSKRSALLTNIVNNFDEADTNEDGKVSMQEAMAYEQSASTTAASTSSSDNTSSTSDTSATDTAARILQQIMLLMQAYGSDSNSNSNTLSLLA